MVLGGLCLVQLAETLLTATLVQQSFLAEVLAVMARLVGSGHSDSQILIWIILYDIEL